MAHDIFISYSSHDKAIADAVCATLEAHKIRCWIAPRDILPGTSWGEALVDAIDSSRLLVLVFSSGANNSPQVMREVERAVSRGIGILPFRIEEVPPSRAMQFFLPSIHWFDALTPPLEKHLHALPDTVRLLFDRIGPGPVKPPTPVPPTPEPGGQEGGATLTPAPSHDSRFYLERPADRELEAALARQTSMIHILGARQVGKTAFLGRGLQQMRARGARVVVTDFQRLRPSDFESLGVFFRTLGEWIAEELELDISVEQFWNTRRNPSRRFNQFVCQEVLGRINEPLVWAMDEVDRLFPCPFRSDVFGQFRSWHNARALEPTQPWRRLTLIMAYTSHRLLIDDCNQSPLNVGCSVALEDFTREEVVALNRRYDSPLRTEAELEAYWNLVGGHPYLVNRGFQYMVESGLDLATLRPRMERDDGIFSDHLRLLLALLSRDAEQCDVVRSLLRGESKASNDSFLRLRSAGVLAGGSIHDMRIRCPLYATFLKKHLL